MARGSRTPSERKAERTIDLHGRRPEDALRYLGQELHAARVRGAREVLVITGRGIGGRSGAPLLRGHVERWLAGPDAARLGVRGCERDAHGGALVVHLR
jgi:DNA-nicking Smr family endonuclease